jgi:D-beta-D-heptose 7-phosphate kinase/D-beta-D-heptose 1-phosphate adenosyltransferase
MAVISGILSQSPSADQRLAGSLEEMAEKVRHLKGLGCSIVLTSGSFDLIHLGHVRYLERAKEYADILVVGVDCDAKIRRRKGPDRPMVPEDERVQMLAYQRPVDLIYLKHEDDEHWGLIKAVSPDVLVLTVDHSYGEAEQEQLLEFCGRIEVVERQASVTTSERIRQMYMHMGERLGPKLAEVLGPKLSEVLGPKLAEVLPGLIESLLQRR